MKVIGADGPPSGAAGALKSAEVWMSHEALLLDYEEALTRKIAVPNFARASSSAHSDTPTTSSPVDRFVASDDAVGFYCTSAHFVWYVRWILSLVLESILIEFDSQDWRSYSSYRRSSCRIFQRITQSDRNQSGSVDGAS